MSVSPKLSFIVHAVFVKCIMAKEILDGQKCGSRLIIFGCLLVSRKTRVRGEKI